ncbi:ATP-binding protein [Sulfitobacter sp. NFXS29]|uniref:AAA family ATPase n=1 Tax=Sulfitobacter sp. NFXS29 TaxID=2818438 RepID=UPI0032DF93F2
MSNARQILSMLNSRAVGDEEHFLSVALQVAAGEARQGRQSSADAIRDAVQKIRGGADKPHVPISFSKPRGDLDGLLDMREPRYRLCDVVLASDLEDRLNVVVRQQNSRERLRAHDRSPSRKVLFAGPPGSGKTMTAEALAGELKLPFFVVRLEGLITRYLGETATKLRMVFDETLKRRGLYLFDEFDAVGGHRDTDNDVAEMRRVLNSFLQFMEEPTSTDSLIVGATNHPSLLDAALVRRFDEILPFDMPSQKQVRALVLRHLRPLKPSKVDWRSIGRAANGLSQAEIARASEEAAKEAILAEQMTVDTSELKTHLDARRAAQAVFAKAK